jgi:hypothetical protein
MDTCIPQKNLSLCIFQDPYKQNHGTALTHAWQPSLKHLNHLHNSRRYQVLLFTDVVTTLLHGNNMSNQGPSFPICTDSTTQPSAGSQCTRGYLPILFLHTVYNCFISLRISYLFFFFISIAHRTKSTPKSQVHTQPCQLANARPDESLSASNI